MTATDLKKLINFWRDQSLTDLKASDQLINRSKLYPQGLFFLHLAIEKLLKSVVVSKTGQHPPFTHNLLALLDRTEIVASPALLKDLAVINEFNLSTRYPDQKAKIGKKLNAAFSKKYLKSGMLIYQWLDKQNTSQK